MAIGNPEVDGKTALDLHFQVKQLEQVNATLLEDVNRQSQRIRELEAELAALRTE
ncbi:MAG: hypothetical protein AB7G28_20685 [Pirellulales bacterium]